LWKRKMVAPGEAGQHQASSESSNGLQRGYKGASSVRILLEGRTCCTT
jgi:hypothetical protein